MNIYKSFEKTKVIATVAIRNVSAKTSFGLGKVINYWSSSEKDEAYCGLTIATDDGGQVTLPCLRVGEVFGSTPVEQYTKPTDDGGITLDTTKFKLECTNGEFKAYLTAAEVEAPKAKK